MRRVLSLLWSFSAVAGLSCMMYHFKWLIETLIVYVASYILVSVVSVLQLALQFIC